MLHLARYATDLKLTPDGDLAITPSGDLATADRVAFLAQQIRNRLKTVSPDWRDGNIGADMEDLLGLPNTRATGQTGEEKIRQALTVDGLLDPDELYIRAVPRSRTEIVYLVLINSEYSPEPLSFQVELDLATGATVLEV